MSESSNSGASFLCPRFLSKDARQRRCRIACSRLSLNPCQNRGCGCKLRHEMSPAPGAQALPGTGAGHRQKSAGEDWPARDSPGHCPDSGTGSGACSGHSQPQALLTPRPGGTVPLAGIHLRALGLGTAPRAARAARMGWLGCRCLPPQSLFPLVPVVGLLSLRRRKGGAPASQERAGLLVAAGFGTPQPAGEQFPQLIPMPAPRLCAACMSHATLGLIHLLARRAPAKAACCCGYSFPAQLSLW